MMKAGIRKRLELAATSSANPRLGIMRPLFVFTAPLSTSSIQILRLRTTRRGSACSNQQKYRTLDRIAIIDLYQTKKKAPTLRSRVGALARVLSKDGSPDGNSCCLRP